MGKCKKRTLSRGVTPYFMTRESAVNDIFRLFEKNKIKNRKPDFRKALNTISLFGISAEELSEAGVAYENLQALKSVLV